MCVAVLDTCQAWCVFLCVCVVARMRVVTDERVLCQGAPCPENGVLLTIVMFCCTIRERDAKNPGNTLRVPVT